MDTFVNGKSLSEKFHAFYFTKSVKDIVLTLPGLADTCQ